MYNSKEKLLIIFSDGAPSDGNPKNICEDLKCKDKEVTIVSCFLTSENIESPK